MKPVRFTGTSREGSFMNYLQRLQYEMFARVRDFGNEHRQLFPESSKAGKAFAVVAQAAAEIEAQRTAGRRVAGEGREKKAPLRVAIGEHLATIVKASALLTPPVADDVFKLPTKQTDAALVEAAKSFVEASQPRAEEFVALGLPATFITELSDVVDRLQRAMLGRRDGQTRQQSVREGIAKAIAKGLDAMRTLDVVVVNTLKDDA